MSRRDAAAILALCAYLKKRIAKIEEAARVTADVTYPDEKTAGTVAGTVVSYTSRITRKPPEPFTMLNPGGFVEWVETRWPTEIEKAVRPSWLNMLAIAAAEHDGNVIDEDGEVCPWVKLNDPIVYTKTSLTKQADEVLAPLLADLTLESLPDYIEEESSE